jgi:UDP-glucose 4-epimerase
LVKSLKKLEYDVVELDCLPGNRVGYFQCDLVRDDLTFLRNLGIDVIVHLAGDKSDPPPTEEAIIDAMESNVQGTIRLLGSIGAAVRRIVYASSISVYGDSEVPYREDQPLMPRTLYGASKAAAEAYLSSYRRSTAVSILRIAQVFGSGTPPHVAPMKMIEDAKSGRVVLTCTKMTKRDYVHVEDVVEPIVSTIKREAYGIFNIGSGKPTSLVKLAEYIRGITGSVIEVVSSTTPEHEVWMSVDKARASLGYAPSWTIEKWVRSELRKQG